MPISRAILALTTAAALLVPVAAPPLAGALPGVGAPSDAEAERDAVLDRRDEVESDLDVLQATDAEITAVLDDLDGAIAAQQRAVDEADAVRLRARAEVRTARRELRAARRDVERLEAAIREMAIASYVHPPTADLVHSLGAQSFSDVLLQRAYLDARARRDVRLLDLLDLAEINAAERAAAVETAAAEAEAAAEAAATALDGLRAEQQRQLAFASRLQDRIDGALAEAAVLADLDAELADQIMAEQAALIARVPPPPAVPPTTAPPVTVPPTDVPSTTVPTTGPSVTSTTIGRSTSTTSTSTPADTDPDAEATDDETPRRSTPKPPLKTVQGITVHADIAADIDALLTAAAADGVELSGWGYRSTDRQIELRRAHCGPTDYDIWERPASLCRPPTAPPGRSLHEQGRAVDFTYEGRVISSRSSPAFVWLDEHAASYGLKNLPSEPWHWSTSGG